jgi:hypothetical protein
MLRSTTWGILYGRVCNYDESYRLSQQNPLCWLDRTSRIDIRQLLYHGLSGACSCRSYVVQTKLDSNQDLGKGSIFGQSERLRRAKARRDETKGGFEAQDRRAQEQTREPSTSQLAVSCARQYKRVTSAGLDSSEDIRRNGGRKVMVGMAKDYEMLAAAYNHYWPGRDKRCRISCLRDSGTARPWRIVC